MQKFENIKSIGKTKETKTTKDVQANINKQQRGNQAY